MASQVFQATGTEQLSRVNSRAFGAGNRRVAHFAPLPQSAGAQVACCALDACMAGLLLHQPQRVAWFGSAAVHANESSKRAHDLLRDRDHPLGPCGTGLHVKLGSAVMHRSVDKAQNTEFLWSQSGAKKG